MNKPEKIQRGLGFDPGATHSLGKGDRMATGSQALPTPVIFPNLFLPIHLSGILLG